VQVLVLAVGLLDFAGIHLDRKRGRIEAAHAGALERQREAQPQRIAAVGAGDVEPGVDGLRAGRVALPGEIEVSGPDRDIERCGLTEGE